MNYTDHDYVLKLLERDREAQHDIRIRIAEELAFVNVPGGQWEPFMWEAYEGRPRYQFDMIKSAAGRAWAEMAANDYSATTQPVSGGSDEDISNIYDGLIRTINNVSSFSDIAARKGKKLIYTGMASWRVISTYLDDSFDQDLKVIPLQNEHERVFYDCSSEMQTNEDAGHVHVLSAIYAKEGKERFKRDIKGLSETRVSEAYTHKPSDLVTVGEILYKKQIKRTLYKLPDGSIVEELPIGAPEDTPSREVTSHKVCSRHYDADGWLSDEKETAFNMLPVVTAYANYDVYEDKVVFHGMINDLMDQQRVFNYVESRKTEEAVLGRPDVLMLTAKQAAGREEEYGNINRDPRRAHLYNHDNEAPPPFVMPGSQPNVALTEISNDMIRNMQLTTGIPNTLTDAEASKQDSDFRSGQRSSLGQLGTYDYYRGWQMALETTAKIQLGAIPKVYDTERAIRITDESNQSSEVWINQRQPDGRLLNDLSAGKYDVCIKVGDSFETRQAKANDGIIQLAQFDPSIVQMNSDILASNIDAPGMQTVADRSRAQLFKAGIIPQSQWTDEEKQQAMQAMQQPKDPDPAQKIAEAELGKANAQTMKAQYDALAKQAEYEHKQQVFQLQAIVKEQELKSKDRDQMMEAMRLEMEKQRKDYENLLTLAQSIETFAKVGQNIDSQTVTMAEGEINERS